MRQNWYCKTPSMYRAPIYRKPRFTAAISFPQITNKLDRRLELQSD